MAFKRVSRARKRDLEEPDRITGFLNEFSEFATKYKVHLLAALGLLVAVIIGVSGVFYFTNKAENKASALLGRGLHKYLTIANQSGLDQAYLEVVDDFNLIINQYSGKQGGKIAKLMFANICYDSGKYGQAIELYNQSLKDFDDNPFLKKLILSSLAYSHLAQKDYRAAADYFEMIASVPDASMQDEALFNLAMVLERQGKRAESIENLERALKVNPNNKMAKKFLLKLKGDSGEG